MNANVTATVGTKFCDGDQYQRGCKADNGKPARAIHTWDGSTITPGELHFCAYHSPFDNVSANTVVEKSTGRKSHGIEIDLTREALVTIAAQYKGTIGNQWHGSQSYPGNRVLYTQVSFPGVYNAASFAEVLTDVFNNVASVELANPVKTFAAEATVLVVINEK